MRAFVLTGLLRYLIINYRYVYGSLAGNDEIYKRSLLPHLEYYNERRCCK